MARQDQTVTNLLGPAGSDYTAGAADITMTAADAVNFEQVAITGDEIVIAHNTDGVNAYYVTIESIASDGLGRTGDITEYSLAAGDIAVFGPFTLNGWRQPGGYLHFKAENAAVEFGVIRGTRIEA